MKHNFEVIHIFDDDKFIDPAIDLIESVFPNKSVYYIIKTTDDPYIYVKSQRVSRIILQNREDEINFAEKLNNSNSKVIFFHALTFVKERLVNDTNSSIVKVWFIWGYDFYRKWKLFKKYLFEKETAIFLNKNKKSNLFKQKIIFNSFTFWLFSEIGTKRNLLPKRIYTILNNNYYTDFYRAVQKIDIVVPVVPTEYKLVKEMKIKALFAPFTYGCIEDMLVDKLSFNVLSKKNILIGNSTNPTNNHLDIFKLISKYNFENRKIYVPLSYGGGSKEYVNHVIEKGYSYFGNNFHPMLDFMPLKDYNKIISGCGFVIFNHIRQQGVGNIISLGFLGAKIFLNSKSPILKHFKNKKVKVLDIKGLNEKSLNTNLTENEYKNNKSLLLELYSRKSVQTKILELLDIVEISLFNKIKTFH